MVKISRAKQIRDELEKRKSKFEKAKADQSDYTEASKAYETARVLYERKDLARNLPKTTGEWLEEYREAREKFITWYQSISQPQYRKGDLEPTTLLRNIRKQYLEGLVEGNIYEKTSLLEFAKMEARRLYDKTLLEKQTSEAVKKKRDRVIKETNPATEALKESRIPTNRNQLVRLISACTGYTVEGEVKEGTQVKYYGKVISVVPRHKELSIGVARNILESVVAGEPTFRKRQRLKD